jgi:hypothetical protein
MSTKGLLTGAALLFVSSTALADPPPGQGQWYPQRDPARNEMREDRREMRENRREMRDDKRDLGRLRDLLMRMDRARAQGDGRTLRDIDVELSRFVRKEWMESRKELMRDRREFVGARREAVHSASAYGSDSRAARDDRRDLRVDFWDAAEEKWFQGELRRIAVQLDRLYGKQDWRSSNRKRYLLNELIALGEHEMAEDVREMHEDRRELREDRGAHGHRPTP